MALFTSIAAGTQAGAKAAGISTDDVLGFFGVGKKSKSAREAENVSGQTTPGTVAYAIDVLEKASGRDAERIAPEAVRVYKNTGSMQQAAALIARKLGYSTKQVTSSWKFTKIEQAIKRAAQQQVTPPPAASATAGSNFMSTVSGSALVVLALIAGAAFFIIRGS